MYQEWTAHLTDSDEKQRFEKKVQSSEKVLERLSDILDIRETGMDMQEMSQKDFENPNWAYKQAFRNGYRSAIWTVQKYLDLDQQKGIMNERKSTGSV